MWQRTAFLGAQLGLVVSAAGLLSSAACAQDQRLDEWPVTAALTSETLGYLPNAVHPGAEVGTELRYTRDPVYELVQTVRLGFLHHPEVMRGGYLETSLVLRLIASFGLYGELGIGVGYQLTGTAADTYVAGQDGGFVAGGNDPRSMARIPLSAAIGFDFASVGAPGVRVFFRYAETVLTPFAPGNSLGLFVSSQLALGVAIPLAPEGWR